MATQFLKLYFLKSIKKKTILHLGKIHARFSEKEVIFWGTQAKKES